MKRIILSFLFILSVVSSFAQSANERVGNLINSNDWFGLKEFYDTNTDSIHPFLDLFGHAMIAHFFNQSEDAVNYCGQLMNHEQIDLGNLLSVSSLMAQNLNKLGRNDDAASTLEAVIEAIAPHKSLVDTATIQGLQTLIGLYRVQSPYNINKLKPFGEKATIPFTFAPVGPADKLSYVIDVDGVINGHHHSITFDTGAGVNVISDSLAVAMGLEFLDFSADVRGIGKQSTRLAIARELTMGELTLYNVPFYVGTMMSGNSEADKHMAHFQIMVGRTIMEAVKYLTIDFANKEITVLSSSDIPLNVKTNLCNSDDGNYQLLCYTYDHTPLIVNPDTGDTSYGDLYPRVIPILERFTRLEKASDTIRMGGAGGWGEVPYYQITDMPLTISDCTVTIPLFDVLAEDSPFDNQNGYDGIIGIDTFRLYKTISFDMSRMILYPTK
ncbi:MAG: retropepsin-like domain-containing protein [Bacteroidales bacterium]|nr:retropepsin-like domain-containing protein [Bacteroidales bacterium]